MNWEAVVATAILGFFAWAWRSALGYHKREMEKQKRELTWKAEIERTEREINDKTLADVIDDSNSRYDKRESK